MFSEHQTQSHSLFKSELEPDKHGKVSAQCFPLEVHVGQDPIIQLSLLHLHWIATQKGNRFIITIHNLFTK